MNHLESYVLREAKSVIIILVFSSTISSQTIKREAPNFLTMEIIYWALDLRLSGWSSSYTMDQSISLGLIADNKLKRKIEFLIFGS